MISANIFAKDVQPTGADPRSVKSTSDTQAASNNQTPSQNEARSFAAVFARSEGNGSAAVTKTLQVKELVKGVPDQNQSDEVSIITDADQESDGEFANDILEAEPSVHLDKTVNTENAPKSASDDTSPKQDRLAGTVNSEPQVEVTSHSLDARENNKKENNLETGSTFNANEPAIRQTTRAEQSVSPDRPPHRESASRILPESNHISFTEAEHLQRDNSSLVAPSNTITASAGELDAEHVGGQFAVSAPPQNFSSPFGEGLPRPTDPGRDAVERDQHEQETVQLSRVFDPGLQKRDVAREGGIEQNVKLHAFDDTEKPGVAGISRQTQETEVKNQGALFDTAEASPTKLPPASHTFASKSIALNSADPKAVQSNDLHASRSKPSPNTERPFLHSGTLRNASEPGEVNVSHLAKPSQAQATRVSSETPASSSPEQPIRQTSLEKTEPGTGHLDHKAAGVSQQKPELSVAARSVANQGNAKADNPDGKVAAEVREKDVTRGIAVEQKTDPVRTAPQPAAQSLVFTRMEQAELASARGGNSSGADLSSHVESDLDVGVRSETSPISRPNYTPASGTPNLSNHVNQQIVFAIRNSTASTTELALNPAELGNVRISINSGEAGITVSILAERTETLDLIRRHADQLAQEFLNIGYGSAEFSFSRQGSQDSFDTVEGSGESEIGDVHSTSTGRSRTEKVNVMNVISSDRIDIRL